MSGEDYTGLRWQKYVEAGGKCQRCGKSSPFQKFSVGDHVSLCAGQLAHAVWDSEKNDYVNAPRRAGGGSRNDEHTVWLCGVCHDFIDNRNQKACPPKPKNEEETAV